MEQCIYKLIAQKLKYRILCGYYQDGSKMPSIRNLSKQEGCNSATMARSIKYIADMGLISCNSTTGYFITTDKQHLEIIRLQEINLMVKTLCDTLFSLGFTKSEMLEMVKISQ